MQQLSHSVVSLLISFFIVSCAETSREDPSKIAEQVEQSVKKNSPGTIATSSGGYYMKAKIDGKEWVATHMMPDDDVNSSYIRIHGENGGDYMNFQLWKRGIELGRKFAFDDERVANLSLEEDAGFWGGKSGEIEIIKLDGKWMEGRFSYKASSSSSAKIVEVTHGFFRLPFVTEGSN